MSASAVPYSESVMDISGERIGKFLVENKVKSAQLGTLMFACLICMVMLGKSGVEFIFSSHWDGNGEERQNCYKLGSLVPNKYSSIPKQI